MQVKFARHSALLILLLAVLLAMPSREALGKGAQSAQVSALVQRGEAALQSGDLVTAEQALTAAYRQTPHAELLFQLGRLAAAQEQLLSAQDLMRRYLNDPAATPDPVKAAEAQKVLARPRPPSGKVRVQGDRGGLVLLDGRLLGRIPLVQPLLAAPGRRTVAIQYPGKLLDVPIEVVAGRMVDIQCTRATGAIFLATPPALLLLSELPEMAPALLDQFLDAVERAAQGRQLTILKTEALLTLDPELKNLPEPKAQAELKKCLSEPECLQRLLRQAKLDYALRVRAKAVDIPPENKVTDKSETPRPKQWEFATELLHVNVLGSASTQSESCAPCTEQRAAAALQEAVSRTLAVGLTRPRGTLTVSSEPPGAQVWLGERLLGQTPLSLSTWSGEYTLELRQPGRAPVRRTIGVEAGKTATIGASLPAAEPPPDQTTPSPAVPILPSPTPAPRHWERGPRPRWRLVVGATSLAIGVALTVAGVVALADRESRNCYPILVMGMLIPPPGCETGVGDVERNLGISATTFGGAFLFTGVGLLAWPGPRRLVR